MNILHKLVEVTGGPSRCRLCFLTAKPEGLRLGRMWRFGDIIAHHQCLMLSSGILQNGEDEEGILGFLPDDIDTEVRRGQHLKCSLCKKNNATIGCCLRSCKKTFHLPCLQLSGGLSQFFGSFDSYCNEHKPKQRVPGLTWKTKTTGKGSKITKKRYYGTSPCGVCLDMVSKMPSVNILWTPCCSGWFHRNCVEYMAESAGSTFFKCPLCNNKEVFEREMQKFGIYIPIEDAKWETEPRAYEDLYKRHSRCDEKRCLCPNGRSTNQEDTDWEIVLCEMCGSSGVHVACGQLDPVFLRWKCETCSGVITPLKAPKPLKPSKWLVDSDSDDNASGSQGEESDEPSALEGCSSSGVPHIISDGPSNDRSRSSSRSTATRKPLVGDVTASSKQRGPRCGECAGCSRDNCGECKFCLDMKKFGGPNKLRQACLMRKCNPDIELDDGDQDDDDIVSIEDEDDESTNNGDSLDEKSSGPTNPAKMSSLDGPVRDCIWNWNCKIDLKVTSQVGDAQNSFVVQENVKKEGLWSWDCRVNVERLSNWKNFVGPRKSESSQPPPQVQAELKCQKCDFSADSADLLNRHQKLHDPARKFVCPICKLRFIKERHVKIHERIHTGEKPHKCDICGESFQESWGLKIHMSKHNSRRKFVCKFCKWRFKSSSALLVHEEKHYKAPSASPSNSYRQIPSTITSNPSRESILASPSSSSQGRLSRRDSQSSKRSDFRRLDRSPSNCSASSLPDIMERSGSISPVGSRMSPFLQSLELAHVSASPVFETPTTRLSRFQNPLEHLHPLETDLSSLVKIEDTGFTEPTIPATHDDQTSRRSTSVVVPRLTRNTTNLPGEDYIVPVFSINKQTDKLSRIVTRTKSGIRPRESFSKYASPSRPKTDDESVNDHDVNDDDDDIIVIDDVNPVVSSAASSRSSSCSKKSRMVNQLSDFLSRGLREESVNSRICRRTEKRRKSALAHKNRAEKSIMKVKKNDPKTGTKKGLKKGFFKKRRKKRKIEGVVMFADDCNVCLMYDIEDLNLETQVADLIDDHEDFDGDHEDFDEDYVDPICIDPLIDVPSDSFIVADEIILEGSAVILRRGEAVIEAINNETEMDPLEQSDEVHLKLEPANISNAHERDPENRMDCSKVESLEITPMSPQKDLTPMELKSEMPLDADSSSEDELRAASIAELSDEILCSEVGSSASVLSNHEDVPDIDDDLISGNPDEENNLGSDTNNVANDLDTNLKTIDEPDKITDELDERQAMILRMSSCELVGEPGTSHVQGSGNVETPRDEQLQSQDKPLLGIDENDMDFEEEPLVNFLELCEDS